MPRHSPDALKTLDRSHRQCSSFSWALTPAGYRTGCLRAARATRPDGRSALRTLQVRSASHPSSSWIEQLALPEETNVMRRERRTLSLHSLRASSTPARVQRVTASCEDAQPNETNARTALERFERIFSNDKKDQLPETGPDGCGQANQSEIHHARRRSGPGMAQSVNPKGDEPPGTLPRTGSHRTQAPAILQDPSSLHIVNRTGRHRRVRRCCKPWFLPGYPTELQPGSPRATSSARSLRAGQTMVELVGIEPTTPCLQSRCSPS